MELLPTSLKLVLAVQKVITSYRSAKVISKASEIADMPSDRTARYAGNTGTSELDGRSFRAFRWVAVPGHGVAPSNDVILK